MKGNRVLTMAMLLIVILLLGCSSNQQKSDSTELITGKVIAEVVPEPSAPVQASEPALKTEDNSFKFACEDGTEVDDPEQCLGITSGKDAVFIIE